MESGPILHLLASNIPNITLPYYWIARTHKGPDCVIDSKIIPDPPRQAISPGLIYGHGKLFLCMGLIALNGPYNPEKWHYKASGNIETFNGCWFLDLEQKVKSSINFININK